MIKTGTMNAADISQRIREAWSRFIVREETRAESSEAPKHLWASQFSSCARAMTLHLKHGHELPPYDADVLAKFRRGRDRERDIKVDLARVGRDCDPPFEVIGQQTHFTAVDRKGRKIISGRTDGEIRFIDAKSSIGRLSYPFEVKDWSVYLTNKIETFEDLFLNKWTRKGGYQLLLYLYGLSQPLGFMILTRPGLPKLLPVELWANSNSDRVDEFLDTAEMGMDHFLAGTLPDYTEDLDECKTCRFCNSFCQPPKLSGSGAQVLLDFELEAALDERASLKAGSVRFAELDGFVKEKLRGIEIGICGKWLIEGKWIKDTKLVFPDPETKRQYQVTEPKGKFALKFYRVGE